MEFNATETHELTQKSTQKNWVPVRDDASWKAMELYYYIESKKIVAIALAMKPGLRGMKWAFFVKRSTTTKIAI